MGAITIERGDTVITKDGKSYKVESVFYDANILRKVEGVDKTEDSPMRRPIFSDQIVRVMKKPVVQTTPETGEAKKEGGK